MSDKIRYKDYVALESFLKNIESATEKERDNLFFCISEYYKPYIIKCSNCILSTACNIFRSDTITIEEERNVLINLAKNLLAKYKINNIDNLLKE